MMNKRALAILLTLVSMVASYFVFAVLPVNADASNQQCWESSFIYTNTSASPGTVSLDLYDSIPETAHYYKTETLQPGETRTVSITGLFPISANNFHSSAVSSLNLTFVDFGIFTRVPYSVCDNGFGKIDDGRINAYDLAAPLAAYCANGGITVYSIDSTGQGTLAFTASLDEIHAALSKAVASGQNVLVEQGLGDSLYALSSNQLTLTGPDVKEAGKTYEFVTTSDVCG